MFLKNLILIISIILFTGCSTKIIGLNQDITVSQDDNGEDEFLNEFEDEMGVEEIYDPFSGYNRVMTSFNDTLYIYFMRPVSNGYEIVVHKEIRNSVNNFFHNILYPIRLVNNVFQGKFKNSTEETERFIKTTKKVIPKTKTFAFAIL